MKQPEINEVFEDSENFTPAKRLKCLEGDSCKQCAYDPIAPCDHGVMCTATSRKDSTDVYFIETDEPLTTRKNENKRNQ